VPAYAAANEGLDGVWEVTSAIEDGQILPIKAIKEKLIRDARLTIQGQTMSFIAPDGKPKVRTFVTNSEVRPRTVDFAGTEKLGSQGIYLLDGDDLVICLSAEEGQPRPTNFTSRQGQDTILITLKRLSGANPPPPAPPVAPTPPPVQPPQPAKEDMRRMLIGTWGHQDDKTIDRIALNPDGTFSVERTWKRGLRKLLDQEERTSGRWDVKDGILTFTVTASTDRDIIGQVYSRRITSLTNTELIYVDNQTGIRRIEWRIR
jgi:uncharacterized protein (TIGR03067 family)